MSVMGFIKNKNYINNNIRLLRSKYLNKYIVVYQQDTKGAFDTYEEAYTFAVSKFGSRGDFFLYYVEEEMAVNFIAQIIA